MRKPVIGGNWKMNKTPQEGVALAAELKELLAEVTDVEIVLCPPFPALVPVGEEIKGSNLALGAQDLYWEREGAFTGAVSPGMVKACGCNFAIIGHSERRHVFGETDEEVTKKIRAALDEGLNVILCVGELLEEREEGQTDAVVKRQLALALEGVTGEEISRVVIAYEPVWAIGTGKAATAEDADQMAAFIRGELVARFGEEEAQRVRIQYGGSVKPENVQSFLQSPEIDGALVGGASLKAQVFADLVKKVKKGDGQ